MRRISKVKPKEISLCLEGANRRIIAMYKSKSAELAKSSDWDESKHPRGDGGKFGTGGGGGGGKRKGPAPTLRDLESFDAKKEARGKTREAEKKTDSAKTYGGHYDAMRAHAAAAAAHEFAGNSRKAESHRATSDYHRDAGDRAAPGGSDSSSPKGDGVSKSANLAKGGSGSGPQMEAAIDEARDGAAAKKSRNSSAGATPVNIEEAISNTDPAIYAKLTTLAKSIDGADGRAYSPQAASIVKAVGRLLAPFSEELTLNDLQSIGKAAGLGAKTKNPDAEEEDEETNADGSSPALKKSAADEDEDEEEEEVAEDEGEDEDEDEEDEQGAEARKSTRRDIAPLGENADNLAKSASDESEDDEDEDEEDEDESDGDEPPAFIRAKIGKNRGENVGKSASTAEAGRFASLEKAHRALVEQNKAMAEEIKKSRKDLDDERDFRQLEAIKKSIREDYPALALEADKYAPMLKSAKEAKDQAGYTALTELLTKCNKQVEGAQAAGGIFQAIGKSSSSKAAEGGGSWSQRIETAVDEQMKKSARGTPRAVVYDEFVQTPEGREMLINHMNERGY